jgi:hypothetical protein
MGKAVCSGFAGIAYLLPGMQNHEVFQLLDEFNPFVGVETVSCLLINRFHR